MKNRSTLRIALPETDLQYNVKNYMDALQCAGAKPLIVTTGSGFAPEAFDGLLLPGGWDIAPERYGQKNRACRQTEPELDALQLAVLDASVKAQLPVLGICRGHQLINVYFGGTLTQHLQSAQHHDRPSAQHPDRVHGTNAAHGGWISRLYGSAFPTNSAHHQAVDRIGSGLIVDQRCEEDGVVEAMHHEKLPIISVQWHPERMCCAHRREDTVDGAVLFQYFLDMCERARA